MEQEELLEMRECEECGASVDMETGRAFLLDEEHVLCFDCAVRRGGQYDPLHDAWRVGPDVSGLPDERRPHP
jgi:hypothetical protein